jgi:hypothetical protein
LQELSQTNIVSNVERKVIDVGSFKREEQKTATQAPKVDKEIEAVKRGNGYQMSSNNKTEIHVRHFIADVV